MTFFFILEIPMGIKDSHTLLLNIRPEIKFTMEHSFEALSFLDILIKKQNSQIITDIALKTTDTQQHLHFKSHHPQICMKSNPSFTR